MKNNHIILSLLSLSLGVSMASFCGQESSDTGNGDGAYWDFTYSDDDAGENGHQADPFGGIEEPNPLNDPFDWPCPQEEEFVFFADMPAEPEDPVTIVNRFVDSVFEQVANTNPLIELMKKTWPVFLNNFDPEESKRRAQSPEHLDPFVALLHQCPGWVIKPVKMDNRGHLEDETLLDFAIGSAVPTAVLKAICDAGARVEQKNVDHAYIWNIPGKPYLAEIYTFIKQRFEEQKAQGCKSGN